MLKKTGYSIGALLLLAAAGVIFYAREQAIDLITNPPETRRPIDSSPASRGLSFENITVTTADNFRLHGWFVPTQNGAVVMVQHGYKNNQASMLDEAEIFARHGYGVLLTSIRAHGNNDGELIAFGQKEMADFDAWFAWLETRDDVDINRVGLFGESLGGTLAIEYTARNPAIKAVVAHSAFSSLEDTIETSIAYFTGLPPFPFAPLIQFWAEATLDTSIEDINAREWISSISPSAVFILHGGNDSTVSPESGHLLYDAALEPKQLWFEDAAGHAAFQREFPEEFEERVIAFFDQYL